MAIQAEVPVAAEEAGPGAISNDRMRKDTYSAARADRSTAQATLDIQAKSQEVSK